ncbi:MAG: ferrous iron transport protein A [Bacteroidales bacterium]|nr:ferrous iron transport protein A [Bacteroidales bacterium]
MISLNDLPVGKKATITAISGGYGLIRKLDILGIRPGKEITKISSQWMKGPVIIRWGNTDIAIGYGMAHKIMVEVK